MAPPSNPQFLPPKQHSTYNWHLALLWVSVMYILKHALALRLVGLVPDSNASLLLGFSAILSVSLV